MDDHRQLVDPDHEQQFARLMAAEPDPDRWAAANASGIGSWSQAKFRFSDPALDAWVAEVSRILESQEALELARRRYPELAGDPYEDL